MEIELSYSTNINNRSTYVKARLSRGTFSVLINSVPAIEEHNYYAKSKVTFDSYAEFEALLQTHLTQYTQNYL